MDFSKRTPPGGGKQRQSMGLFTGRTKFAEPFGWGRVDMYGLVAAFQVCGEKGVTLSIAPGNGGAGVTVRLYAGEKGDYGYAADPEQLDELLALIIEKMGSKSEDVVMALKGVTIVSPASMPAD